ncbi:hypothetical protein [Tsukamurella tyrosinosolvens]|uniref:hypothetical protein n=1 Tax=Tsukamurella tyrosinosolvens TaxID=57704 RepID=UPI002DD44582|nr:hypothetical protein [Tsukamurella tyrosinosolvens]MEC4616429.1 hypothetical protein [Tsukamurella tyrosinosolvens]
MHAFTRILLFAEADEAAEVVDAFIALAGIGDPPWLLYVRRDGSETRAATLRIGDMTVDVAIGARAIPAVLEVSVPDLPRALERALVAGFSAAVWPREEALKEVTVVAGGMQITAITEAALIDRRGA